MKFSKLQYTFLYLLLFFPFISFSQVKTDSLENLLKKSVGIDRISVLNKLSVVYVEISPKKSIEYGKHALNLSLKLDNESLIAKSSENIGDGNLKLGNIDTAEYYYNKSFEVFNKLNNNEALIILYIKLGETYKKQGEIDKAFEAFEYALGICEDFNIDNKKGLVIIKLAEIYYMQGDLTKAIVSSFDALDFAQKAKDRYNLADVYTNLGKIYFMLEDYERTYEFQSFALNLAIELDDFERTIIAYNNIVKFYLSANLIDSAENLANKILLVHNEKNNKVGYEYTAFNLGNIFKYKKEYTKAVEYYSQSLDRCIEINDIYLKVENYLAFSEIYLSLENLKVAEEFLEKSNSYIKKYSLINEYKGYLFCSILNEKKGRYKEALIYHQKYAIMKDSILNSHRTNTVAKIKTTSELHKQKNAILSLQKEKSSQTRQIESFQSFKTISITGSTVIFILLILLLINVRNKVNANKNLKKQNKEITKKNYEIEEQTAILTRLIQEHEKLTIAASQTDNAIIIANTDGKIEWINDGYTRMYGFTTNEFPDSEENTYEKISSYPLAKEIFKKAIDEKKSQTYDSDVVSKNGKKYRIQTTLTPILNDKNEVMKLIAIDSDVSKLKKIETELQKLLVTKDKFFSIIAHDLKNPFNALIGIAQLLVRGHERMSPEKIKHFLNNLYQISKNGYELLINLLEWSRSQMGSISYEPKTLNVHSITEETFSLYSAKAEQKEILLNNNINKNSTVYSDQNMLKTIFRNLVSNALKFTDRGGVIEVSEKDTEDFKEISICDTGIGIDLEDIKKLFRLDENFTSHGTEDELGTGLGLILCKEFVEKHGGEIWVESKPGNGSKFIFSLPINNHEE